ncbi:MAG TPA: hypothetical protein VN914_08630 [Polyangia bacterium]|nr:hypothetical protein [Polyangia bacterium]
MRTSALTALVTLTLAAPLAAHAGTKTREMTKIVGYSTNAQWEFTQGNILTFVSVVATQNDLSGTAGTAEDAFVALAISRADLDTGNVLLDGVAYLGVGLPGTFQINVDHNLGTATLHVQDAVFQDDSTFTFFNINLDLTWTATGDAYTSKSQDRIKEPGLKINSHFKGTFRDGVARGSIFGKNTQWTPVDSSSAQLQFNQFGQHTITTDTP